MHRKKCIHLIFFEFFLYIHLFFIDYHKNHIFLKTNNGLYCLTLRFSFRMLCFEMIDPLLFNLNFERHNEWIEKIKTKSL